MTDPVHRLAALCSIRLIPVLLIAGSVAACSSMPSMPRLPMLGSRAPVEEIVENDPADQLYNQGVALANRGEYTAAAKKFEDVDRQHPYSDLARRAILMCEKGGYKLPSEKYNRWKDVIIDFNASGGARVK